MPSHPLPGFATSPSAAADPVPVAEPGPDVSQMLYGGGTTRAPTTQEKATTEIISILQDSIKELTTAVEHLTTSKRQRFSSRRKRNQTGQAICYQCGRPGHIMRQCRASQPPSAGRHPYLLPGNKRARVLESDLETNKETPSTPHSVSPSC